jgi:hypothetical protein
MKEEENFTAKELRYSFLKKIKSIEVMLIDDKIGATRGDGKPNFEFMLMMNTTRHLLATTKAFGEENELMDYIDDNDLIVGDFKDVI